MNPVEQLLAEHKEQDPAVNAPQRDDHEAPAEEAKQSAAVILVNIAEQRYRLGVTPSGDPFAYEPQRPHLARMFREGRNGLRAELARQFYDQVGKAAPQQALADALLILEGKAADATPQELHLRVAEHDGAIYIDAGDVAATVYRIAGGTWTTETTAPVKFRRTELTGELPQPEAHPQGAPGIMDLFGHLNVAEEDHRQVLAWQVAALVAPTIPHPVLALLAEQGAAKSTATNRIGQLVDPSAVQVRTAPQGEEKWLTTAAGSWVVGLDNVSHIPPWFSDALCRAVTGDGDVKRKLYTDGSLSVIQFRRCIIMNGIDLGGIRGDLADRLLAVDLHRIPKGQRRDEEEMNTAWKQDHPRLFAALLDFAAVVHAHLPSVRLEEMPRMADFARILAAVDDVADRLGMVGGSALARFTSRAERLAEDSLQSDPFIVATLDVASQGGIYELTSTEILNAVRDHMRAEDEGWKPPRTGWPKSARAVTGLLKRNVPQMLKTGWTVEDDGGRNKRNAVQWTIEREIGGNPSSPGSLTRSSQVTGLKSGELSESPSLAGNLANSPGELSAPQASYPVSTNSPENNPLTSERRVSELSEPQTTPISSSTAPDEGVMARAAVWEGLSTHPQTIDQIKKQVTLHYRDQTETILAELIADGTVEQHDDGTHSLT